MRRARWLRGSLDIKFIWSYEFDPDDAEKVSAKNRELDSEIEKSPEEYPKMSTSYMTGLGKVFRIVEAGDEEQLIHLAMHFFPEDRWEFTPIFGGAKVSEVYRKMGK